MKYERTIIPCLKIHPNQLIAYNQIHYHHHKPPRHSSTYQSSLTITEIINGKCQFKTVSRSFLDSKRSGDGKLSKQAKKRLKLAIEYFLTINKRNPSKSKFSGSGYQGFISFVTLTLPAAQVHSDKEIKAKCLNQMLIELHRYHGIKKYVWRAEYQKNGNIHFHLLIDCFIPYNDIRTRWNRIINKLGYVLKYKANMLEWHSEGFKVRTELLGKWKYEAQKKAYENGVRTEWSQPNTTDVHQIKNIRDIKNYLIKYCTKSKQENTKPNILNEDDKPEIGRAWGASIILSNIKGATTEIDTETENQLNFIKKSFPDKYYEAPYYSILDIDIEMVEQMKCFRLKDLFYKYLFENFAYSTQLKL